MATEQKKVINPEVEGVLYTPCGSNIQPIYERVYDKATGKNLVVKTGDFDIDEFIQASNCKTDLAMLRQEMIANGTLPSVSDEVVDMTLFPENIHEVFSTVNQAEKTYNELPDSVKAIFRSKDEFLAALIAGNYETKLINGLQSKNEGQITQEEKKEGNE